MNPSPGFQQSLTFFEGALIIMGSADAALFNALDGVKSLLGLVDLSIISKHSPIKIAVDLHRQIERNARRKPRLFVFALDALGNLFAEDQHGVVFAVESETGLIRHIWDNQWSWAKAVAHDSATLSGRLLWSEVMQLCDFPIDQSVRLVPTKPLAFGGAKNPFNLLPLPLAEAYTHYARVAELHGRYRAGESVTWSAATAQLEQEIVHV